MLEYDFEESVGYWICMSAHLFERAMNEQLASQGITYRHVQVLGWLALVGNLSQTELADRMNIEPPTLVGILDRMEAQGWLAREADPEDRRRKIITPLPKAQQAWSKITASARRIRAQAVAGLDEHQVRTLKELLSVVRENLEAQSRARVAGEA